MASTAWLARAAAPLRLAPALRGRDALRIPMASPRGRGRGVAPPPAAMTTRAVEEARGRHARTLHAVFAHPTSANLRWRDVLSMLESFGAAHHPASGGAKERVELAGRALYLAKPHSGRHDAISLAAAHEILALRRFLEAAGLAPADACGARSTAAAAHAAEHAAHVAIHTAEKPSERQPASSPSEALDGRHVLLWVSHAEARLYRTQAPGAGAACAPVLLHPPGDPDGVRRHLRAKKAQAHAIAPPSAAGDRLPVLDAAFAKNILAALPPDGVDEIILAGHGTGKASAADALLAAMEARAPALARKVSHRMRLSEGHATDAELCAAAREVYHQRHAEQAAAAAASQAVTGKE